MANRGIFYLGFALWNKVGFSSLQNDLTSIVAKIHSLCLFITEPQMVQSELFVISDLFVIYCMFVAHCLQQGTYFAIYVWNTFPNLSFYVWTGLESQVLSHTPL